MVKNDCNKDIKYKRKYNSNNDDSNRSNKRNDKIRKK